MELGEKIALLRRQRGLSQEQLAEHLGVTRQSVSKWEGDAALPEIVKLITLSDFFGVTVDDLVREAPMDGREVGELALRREIRALAEDVRGVAGGIVAYTSERRLLGLPLLSIRIGNARNPNRHNTAVGIVAIGNFAVGVVGIGLLSAGAVSIGLVSLGLIALGGVSIGGVAVGGSAIGLVSLGISALGAFRAAGIAAEVLKP